MDKCSDLLPDYFSFVKGVIDTEDIPLNISRETLQDNKNIKLIAKSIESKVKKELLSMIDNERDKYEEFYKAFGMGLKFGIYNDYGMNKDKLSDLIMFYSSKDKKLTTLKEYVSRMKEGQETIYYASGEDKASLKSSFQAGFMGGVDVEYRATKEIGVSLGAYYAKQGFRFSSYEATIDADRRKYQGISDYHTNLHYLNVPLMVKGYVTRQLAFMVGVQAGFLLNDPKYEFTSIDIERDQYGGATYDNSQKVSDSWPAKKVDVSLPIGLSYEYMGVVLDARYNLGLTNVDDSPGHDDSCKNRVFTFSVGYRFAL